ncbi:MAG: outer membrane protein assembly factor BamB family protein, partial [Promethearchaeota archaeon]
MDSNLNPTGRTFLTQTINDFGAFSLNQSLIATDYIEIITQGYYFNEITGKISDSPLTLRVITKLSNSTQININILTTLETERIKYLILNQGMSFDDAKKQAEQEVLKIFKIPESIIENITLFEKMDICKEGISNAILLAASAILQGNNTVGELSELIAKISADIKTDGSLDDPTYVDQLNENARQLNFAKIRNNLIQRYEYLGLHVNIPKFEDYVDVDGDGLINLIDYQLLSPIGPVNQERPILNWTSSNMKNATYHVQVATDENFTTIIEDKDGLTNTSYRIKNTLNNYYTYYWRVFIYNESKVERLWASYENFTIDLISPIPGSEGVECIEKTGTTLHVKWAGASDFITTDYKKFIYHVYVSKLKNLTTIEDIENNATEFVIGGGAIFEFTYEYDNYLGCYFVHTNIYYKEILNCTSDMTLYFYIIVEDEAGNKAKYPSLPIAFPPELDWTFSTGNDDYFVTNPAVDLFGNIYIGANNGKLYAINFTGNLSWVHNFGGGNLTTPSIDVNGIIYIGNSNGNLYALYPNGTLKWVFATGSSIESCPAINGTKGIFVSTINGTLYALNMDGNQRWKYSSNCTYYSSSSPIISKTGMIYVSYQSSTN